MLTGKMNSIPVHASPGVLLRVGKYPVAHQEYVCRGSQSQYLPDLCTPTIARSKMLVKFPAQELLQERHGKLPGMNPSESP